MCSIYDFSSIYHRVNRWIIVTVLYLLTNIKIYEFANEFSKTPLRYWSQQERNESYREVLNAALKWSHAYYYVATPTISYVGQHATTSLQCNLQVLFFKNVRTLLSTGSMFANLNIR